MCLSKKSFIYLCVFAFTYFVMCPSVHQMGDTIRHDVILKVKVHSQQDNFNNNYSFDPLSFAKKFKTADIKQIRTCAVVFSQSSLPVSDISALSTVKLIL